MSKSLNSLIPDSKHLLELEPEELAGFLLEIFHSYNETEKKSQLNSQSFIHPEKLKPYPQDQWDDIGEALMEAWAWLEREGLLAPRPREGGDWRFITRKGRGIKNRIDLETFRKGNLLQKDLLHTTIAEKVWSLFIRGEYDTAVFQAFKEVEVSVRKKCGYQDNQIGVALMGKAFDEEKGPLSDMSIQKAERIAVRNLFLGAIGSYKNPNSHRHVSIGAEEAVEMIVLASHLLRIVDSQKVKP